MLDYFQYIGSKCFYIFSHWNHICSNTYISNPDITDSTTWNLLAVLWCMFCHLWTILDPDARNQRIIYTTDQADVQERTKRVSVALSWEHVC